MKILLFSLILFFIPVILVAQIKVVGKVAGTDGKPISSVNVLLLNPVDSSLVTGCVTNEAGEYKMDKLSSGKYMIRYKAVGFLSRYSPEFRLLAGDGARSFATQVMEVDVKELKEVVVRKEKPLYQGQLYGTTVNVENSVLTKGSSVLQVLERSPGVYLDHHHNIIELNGKSGVMVMINGKMLRIPSTQVLSLLNSMSADNIEKIELLTTPPVKYDADGNAGMINIVTKKNKEYGTNGSYSVTGGYGWREKAGASIRVEHNTKDVEIYGSYSYSHDRGHENWFANGSQNIALFGGYTYFDFWSEQRPVLDNHNATIGVDTWINSKTKIGSNINYNYTRASSDVTNLGNYILQSDSLLQLNASVHGLSHQKNLITSLYLERNLGDGEKINFDIDYLYYSNDNPTNIESSFINKNGQAVVVDDDLFAPRQRGLSNTAVNVGVGKLDYTKQLTETVKLEAGGKWTSTGNTGLSGIQSMANGGWEDLLGKSSDIDMKENIGAAYSSVNAVLNTSSSLIAGLRYEYSDTRMDNAENNQRITERKLGKFFPGIFFTHKLNDKSNIEMSYTKRISRPSYIDLASNITYNDPVSVFTGNPLLKPTITNNFKMGYNYDGYSFSVLLGRDNNPIARYQIVSDSAKNLIYISPQNLKYQNNLVLDIRLPWKVNNWWDMTYGFVGGVRHVNVDYTINPFEKTWSDYSVFNSQTFKLPKQVYLEVSGTYNSLTYAGTNKVAGFGMVNIGIKKELKNNSGALQLSVSDVLRSMHIQSYLGQVTDMPFSLRSHVDYNSESRKFPVIKLTYSKSFGSNPMKGQQKKDIGSGDERDRLKKQ